MTVTNRLGAAVTLLAILAACDSSSPTEPEDASVTGTTVATESYSGSFEMGGSSSHQIGVGASGTAEAVLVGLDPLPTLTVGVGFGSPTDAGDCTLTTQDSTAHVGDVVSTAVSAGILCVSVFDVGNVPAGVVIDYTVELHLPSTPIEIESFTGAFGMGETACHDVTAGGEGSIEMTLLELEPLNTLTVGMGVGTPGSAGGCELFAEDQDVGAGDILLADEIDPGPYCVCVFDVGNIFAGQTTSYDVRVEHP